MCFLLFKKLNGASLTDIHNNFALNSLKDFDFHHVPRLNRIGSGVGFFLRKGFKVTKTEWRSFSSMECMECMESITHGNSSIKLITIYRPPSSKNNKATPSTFFKEFSILLEIVNTTPGYLLLTGHYNFHIESSNDSCAATFRDLLESIGLTQHVKGPTHSNGHTLDLLIDRQEDEISNLSIVSDLPSDHSAVLCTIAFSRPKPSKIYLKQRRLRNIDINAFKSDILNSPLHSEMSNITCTDLNSLTDQYNRVLPCGNPFDYFTP